MASRADAIPMGGTADYSIWRVILAASVGTMIEWYDFYIFGSLAVVLSQKFYPPGNPTFAFIAYLSTFAVGFMVRPFGALFFGRIGDLVGRKYAFLVTLSVMGFGTFLIGLMPTYATAGWFAPIALICIRVFQGLALGGEYGGAAIYVAEHVPDKKRGYWTSYIQITATLGLFLSIITVIVLQFYMTPQNFQSYGWRMLFLVSLLGATAGQGVVWYTGQYYALFYLQSILKVNLRTAFIIVALAMLFAMPFFTVFGALSDKIGRKKIIMAGCLLAVVTYYPIYHAMRDAAGNNVVTFRSQRNPVTGAPTLTPLTTDATGKQVPAPVAPNPNVPLLTFLVFIQVIYVTMVYGPIAAYLVEAYPAKIRYSAFSLPYHIGNGVFGGLVPLVGVYLCEATGNIYAGLWYPMTVAAVTFVVGSIFLKETHGHKIWDEVGGEVASASR